MGKRTYIPLDFSKGQYAAGDAGSIPDGYARALLNYLPRPNRLTARPPFVYDSLMSVAGLLNFDDTTNNVSRLCAINTSRALFEKATSGETWSSSIGTISAGTRLTGYTNYRGVVYGMMEDSSGLPSQAFSFDGTNLSSTPFNSVIAARSIVTFNDRNFLLYPRITVSPEQPGGGYTVNDIAYNFSIAGWVKTNITAQDVVVSGATYTRLYPTSTTAASLTFGFHSPLSIVAIPASATATPYLVRWPMRGLHASYRMPFTLQAVIDSHWLGATAYALGDTVADGAGYYHRVITAGTSGGGAPAWAATTGATTADNTVTWINEGSDVIASLEDYIPNATDTPDFTVFWLPVNVPPSHGNGNQPITSMNVRLRLFNTMTPTITLAPIDVAFRDGLADGDPRKNNQGLQITKGDFYFPFYNCETAITSTVDLSSIVWSGIGLPKQITASNTYALTEAVGHPTAGAVLGGRLVAFKRNAFWVFQGTTDFYVPIRRESYNDAVGCIGQLALSEMEDTVFFIGENEVYSFSVGGTPQPLCGEAMREEVMGRGANWVESQSTYKRPVMTIDRYRLILWIYTQKGKLYSYDLRTQQWGTHQVSTGIEIDAMHFNANTNEVYVSFGGYGLSRIDYTAAQNDTIDNTANTYAGTVRIVFKPIELYQPPRFDATLEEIRGFHAATASQTGQTVVASYSPNQGTSYPTSVTVTAAPLSTSGEMVPLRLPATQTGPSVTVKLEHIGKLGETEWSLSPRFSAAINVRRGEYIQNNPTPVSQSL